MRPCWRGGLPEATWENARSEGVAQRVDIRDGDMRHRCRTWNSAHLLNVMHIDCPHCHRGLEYAAERPSFCAFCGTPLPAVQAETRDVLDPDATLAPRQEAVPGPNALPSTLGGYRILRQIGSGGMGSVYEAQDTFSGQRVAVKVIAREYSGSELTVDRFRQEGRLASLISHPRCVFVLAAEEEAGLPYIVMELMPGTNLQQLVEKNGPLPIQDAILKVLDAIEGLEEAHRLGVVHRDVKPSNCFVLEDGRVKIGDFGLAKSLLGGADLTKTGSFLGTLLYASPEQIKGEHIDHQSDVYSVAATLYFLLSGKAPFDSKDAAATLARTVSEDPPPLRGLRPEVSRGLEKVIRRGLERQPAGRWKNMQAFRAALSQFVPGQLSMGGMGLRAAAIVFDIALFSFLKMLLFEFLEPPSSTEQIVVRTLVSAFLFISYFAIFEATWAATPGKWLLRLMVRSVAANDRTAPIRGVWRAILFYLFTRFLWDLASLAPEEGPHAELFQLLGFASAPLGVLLLVSTMRARNGYRGLHELLSGTCVVRLPWPKRSEVYSSHKPGRLLRNLAPPDGLPETIGTYKVRGILRQRPDESLALAEDVVLGRKILLLCRPLAAPPISAARRNLHRLTRLRWLNAGQLGSVRWDAFLAPVGCPLPDLCEPTRRIPWRGYRAILEQMTDELVAACADGTLPPTLDVEQVWIQPNGRVQLLDTPLDSGSSDNTLPAATSEQQRSLSLLRHASHLALEGSVGPNPDSPRSIQAPMPIHAGALLQRLGDGPDGVDSVAQFRTELLATQDQVTEVNARLRAVHLVMVALAFAIPFFVMFGFTWKVVTAEHWEQFVHVRGSDARSLEDLEFWMQLGGSIILLFFPIVWVLWVFLFRGGLTLGMMGVSLVGRGGQPASRFRCAWRALLVWTPMTALLYLALTIKVHYSVPESLPLALVWLALALQIGGLVLTLCFPSRSLQDRLAGTYLVPR